MAGDTQFLIEGKNLRHFFFVLSGKCVGQPIAKMDALALMVLRYNASINPYMLLEDGYHAVYINSCLLHQVLPNSTKSSLSSDCFIFHNDNYQQYKVFLYVMYKGKDTLFCRNGGFNPRLHRIKSNII